MTTTTETDELRIKILEVLKEIRDSINVIPELYDALKPIAERYPETQHELHLNQIAIEFEGIALVANEGAEILREAEKKIKAQQNE